MSRFNQFIAHIAPGFALRREVAIRRLKRLENFKESQRTFDAIKGGRMRHDLLSTTKSPNAALKSSEALRYHIRQLEYNNGFMSGPIARLVNHVVGQGIRFQARVTADDEKTGSRSPGTLTEAVAETWNLQAETGFKRWGKKADMRLIQSFFEIQRTVQGALERDGETLAVGRQSKRTDRIIPYCIELFEIDRLKTPLSQWKNPKIRDGIRYDDEGVPESYYILKCHPGETLGLGLKDDDFDEIKAFNPNGTRKVMHLFNVIRPEQSRGYSRLAAGLKAFQDLDRYREAEIYAALEDACLTGFIKTQQPADFQANFTQGNITDSSGDDTTRRYHEFAPGQMNYLDPNEDITIHAPKRPNDQLEVFTNYLLRDPANALDIPLEILAQDWKGMNYSNARTVLVMFFISMRVRQRYLIDHLCTPVYENVIRDMILHDHVPAVDLALRPEFENHAWIPPGWQWVDPVKEAQGKAIELTNNFDTLTDILAGTGKDIDETLETRARELKKFKDLEGKYDIKFPAASSAKASGGSPPGPADKDDDEGKEDEEDDEERNLRRIK